MNKFLCIVFLCVFAKITTTAQQTIFIDSVYIKTSLDSAIGYPKGYNKQIIYNNPKVYSLDSLFIDNAYKSQLSQDSIYSYTFKNIQNPLKLDLIFKINAFKISLLYDTNYGNILGDTIILNDSQAKFIIVPKYGYRIDSVFLNGIFTNLNSDTIIIDTVREQQNIRVVFKQITYTISATTNSALFGSLSPIGTIVVNKGSSQQFIYSANPGYSIDSVIIDGVHNLNYLFYYTFTTIEANHRIRIVFKPATNQNLTRYNIITNISNGGSATNNIKLQILQNIDTTTIDSGVRVFYVINPNATFTLDSLFLNGNFIPNLRDTLFLNNITSNQTIRVLFKPKPIPIPRYSIISFMSSGGNVTNNLKLNQLMNIDTTTVDSGINVFYVFTPNVNYKIDSVFLNGAFVSNIHDTLFLNNITTNQTIRVIFKQITYIITATTNAALFGSLTPKGNIVVNKGSSQQFIYTANTGYIIDSVIVDGIKIDSLQSYTFKSIANNHTIYISFKVKALPSNRLPINNFKITAQNISCIGKTDGAISILFDSALNYNVILKSANYYIKVAISSGIITQYPTTPINFNNLSAGNYSLIFYYNNLDSNTGYIFNISINQPPQLVTLTNMVENTLQLNLSGAPNYTITVNQEVFTTAQPHFELKLQKGFNKITVRTDKDCQGVFTKEVFVSENMMLYPNPTQERLQIFVAGADPEVHLKIFNEHGKVLLNKSFTIPENRILPLNVSHYKQGAYFIDVKGLTIKGVLNFIKQ